MAERSFTKEVRSLRLGKGEEFSGEAILAVTKALLQSGVAYVGGYQGAPVSHLMDVLADAVDILAELGVRFETSASEATAAAMLAASVNYPLRGAVTWKSTVGTNVASDALSNLSSSGVLGGALIVIGEDYGEGASIMQERSHAFAMKSQIWLLDPRPHLPTIVRMVEQGFALSEASNTPVMLMMRIRACHMHGRFIAKDNVPPPFTLRDALQHPARSQERIILPPATYLQEQRKVADRWPAALAHIRKARLNQVLDGEVEQLGVIVQGGLANTLLRALAELGLADFFGKSRIPILVLNVTYPLLPEEVCAFAAGKKAVLVVEEGQPAFIEQAVHQLLRQGGVDAAVAGKDLLPLAGEYTGAVIKAGLQEFMDAWRAKPSLWTPPKDAPQAIPLKDLGYQKPLPARPSGLCTGCPERPLFAAMRLVEQELGPQHVSADIGCHSFAAMPPFDMGASIMGYGLGAASSAALHAGGGKRPISMMGDGGFWHNGLTSGIGNAVFNKHDGVTIVVDNGYSAATGGQAIPSSKSGRAHQQPGGSIEKAVRGVGVDWVRKVHTYDMAQTGAALREALTTDYAGPKVIIAEGECMLNRQRRTRPLRQQRLRQGKRTVTQRFGVDADVCTGDHSCIRLSGCPSLTLKSNPDPLRSRPVAHVDSSCVGCGVCGSVAHAAVLCPSFHRVDVITHPNLWDRLLARARERVIAWLSPREGEDAPVSKADARLQAADTGHHDGGRKGSGRGGTGRRREESARATSRPEKAESHPTTVAPTITDTPLSSPQPGKAELRPAAAAPTSAGTPRPPPPHGQAEHRAAAVAPAVSAAPQAPDARTVGDGNILGFGEGGLDRPLTLTLAALGGQGGGVVASWLVDVAERCGFHVQATSVPGVAQRTGATIYYLEFHPREERKPAPVMGLMPTPGLSDVVVASELLEAVRMVERGIVNRTQTTLIASTHRAYTIGEKSIAGDGRCDADELLRTARSSARRLVTLDMDAIAQAQGAVISAAMFGAIVGAGVTPFPAQACRAAIRASNIAVEANLACFDAALASSANKGDASDQCEMPNGSGACDPAPQSDGTDAAHPVRNPAGRTGALEAGLAGKPARQRSNPPQAEAQGDRQQIDAFPVSLRPLLNQCAQRLADYQDGAYANEFLARMTEILSLDHPQRDYRLSQATARALTLWMTFEDTIRVADLKTRASRRRRLRREAAVQPGQVMRATEFLHPRLEEICGTFPQGLGRALMASPTMRKLLAQFIGPRTVVTSNITGHLLLRSLAALRPLRRRTLRFAEEQAEMDAWLGLIKGCAASNYALACELAECQQLASGYGDTLARGKDRLQEVLDYARRAMHAADAASQVRTMREQTLNGVPHPANAPEQAPPLRAAAG